MRRLSILTAAVTLALIVPAAPAFAKSYDLPTAVIGVVVEADGSLSVTEQITFSFDGSFSGAFRDIPTRSGERVRNVAVSENGAAFTSGASTVLGSSGDPGTFGVDDLGSRTRVVWHYRATNEQRTFTVTYRLSGVAVAYDDVVDVNFRVWGDEWVTGIDRLTAFMLVPGSPSSGEVLVFGHPGTVDGETSLGSDGISPDLIARGVPAHQWVEMRVVIPRAALSSTNGATVRSGTGLAGILADEDAESARVEALDDWVAPSVGLLAGIAALIPASLIGAWALFGKEPRTKFDQRYEHAPPSDLEPAAVAALLSQGSVDETAFTATLFDLIRRGVYAAHPVSVERKTWGGLKRETITDLEIAPGTPVESMRGYERNVETVVDRVLADGPQPLTEFRKRIREDAVANAATYSAFTAAASKAVVSKRLIDERGLTTARGLTLFWVAIGVGGWFMVDALPWVRAASDSVAVIVKVGVTVIAGLGALATLIST
ncbi:DUF2207 domain-containing protein, partial [bacterium]|nr:DUF2207 domain-containing protein [bacterium]